MMKKQYVSGLFLTLLTVALPGAARAQQDQTPPAPMPPGIKMGGGDSMMTMSSSIDLLSPMSQEASGTAWLPASSPMYGKMFMRPDGSMLMLHGAITPRYVDVGSKRGDKKADAPNWFMGMYSHPLGAQGQLGVRAMLSLDPITEGGYGYPLLFQTGESWHHQPLHDRQHPHDLVSELSVDYSRLLRANTSGYLYFGYPGEPALGPPTFMHRLIAFDLPDAPIGHHWQDATHITFGVATAGLNFANRFKVEGSVFNGREPDEDRYDFDPMRFDSQGARLSYNPDPNNAFQVSYGLIKNAEGDNVDQHRTTASWIYNRSLGPDANFTSTLSWGENNLASDEKKSDSFLAEADWQRGRDSLFTRLENIRKSGRELVLPTDAKYALGAYTVGFIHDLAHGQGIDTGVGASLTLNTKPSALDPYYGKGSPVGFQIMLRLRPSRMDMSSMPGMPKMPGMGSMPGMPPGNQPGAVVAPDIKVTAALGDNDPAGPRVGVAAPLIVTVTNADGQPVSGATVTAVAMTTMDMGTTRPPMREEKPGRYVGNVRLSMAGAWRVTVQVALPNNGPTVTRTLDVTARR